MYHLKVLFTVFSSKIKFLQITFGCFFIFFTQNFQHPFYIFINIFKKIFLV